MNTLIFLMSLTNLNLFINGKYLSSTKVDSRITLEQYRSVNELSEKMYFLHNESTISLDSEKDLKLCDIIQNNSQIHMLDKNIDTDFTTNNISNDIYLMNSQQSKDDLDLFPKHDKTLFSRKKRTRSLKNLQESRIYLFS
jgi:hypothetical protein